MKKYYFHKQIFYPLILFIFFTSCNEQERTKQSKTITAVKGGAKKFVDDPYFVESSDTVSTHGPRSITRNMLQDNNGDIWFATWEGIIRCDLRTGSELFTNITLKEGLRHFHVFSILKDKNGNLWFGTIGGGVYQYDLASGQFTNFTTKDGLVDNNVECMLEDKAGNIWFGTFDGASRYDPSASPGTGSKTFTNFTWRDGLWGNSIHTIAQDKTGKIWFGTDNGVSCYNGRFFTYFTNKEDRPFSNVRSIIEDKNGDILIGSESDGLCIYDPATSLSRGFKSLTTIITIFTSYIFEDNTGNIWFSASDDGVGVIPDFPVNGAKNNNANGGMVLYRYDPAAALRTGSKSFNKIIEKNAPDDFQIFGIFEDKTGNIWFGTMQGVCRYNPVSGELTDYTDKPK